MNVLIRYVDGSSVMGDESDWPRLPSEQVDWVQVDGIRVAGQSVYWLRRVGGAWRFGGASFYEQAPFEAEITADGQREVPIAGDSIPDLQHRDVKLGWWWPDG